REAVAAVTAGEGVARRAGHADHGAADRGAAGIAHLAAHDGSAAPPGGLQRQESDQRSVHVTKSVAGRRLSKSTLKSTLSATLPFGTVTVPGCVVSAALR